MNASFITDYAMILQKIDAVDPVQYGKTRNYIDGAVTRLSPYISRGVIITTQVLNRILDKGYALPQIESFVKELCWRDYFQRVGQFRDLNKAIRQQQETILNNGIPVQVLNATTGIQGIDDAINHLYQTGYMHNHCRMYTASVVCNFAKSHWLHPAQWMYYHLLDGDWASNACSWQWVAGANSNKKYYAGQDNINKYTATYQTNTFLDKSYVELEQMEVPTQLMANQTFLMDTVLPEGELLSFGHSLPTFIYNYYNIDPLWHAGESGNRILLVEPAFFKNYPISHKCMAFMLALGKNIPGLQVYVGSFKSLRNTFSIDEIYYKEHPLNIGYSGTEEPRDWVTAAVNGYHPSFFSYWKKVEKQLVHKYQ